MNRKQPIKNGNSSLSKLSFAGKFPVVIVCSAIVVVVAVALRVRGALNDLWLDEIWSLGIASTLQSPVEIFTKVHRANNHYLNTLILYFLGQHGNWPGYRIPAVVAGSVAVILAGLIGYRRDKTNALIAMLVTASSYVLVLYSSEARGYAFVICFSFLSYYLLDLYLDNPRYSVGLLFSLSAILGFISHLVFIHFFVAAFLWTSWRILQSPRPVVKCMITTIFSCYIVPAAFLAGLYFIDIRRLEIGGGPHVGLLDGYTESLAWSVGAPATDLTQKIGIVIAAAGLIAGLWILWREKSSSFVFFLSVIVLAPLGLALFGHTEMFYARFFIIGTAFLSILLSFVLARIYERGSAGRVICSVLLAAYVAANGCHIAILFKYGRGQITEAIRFMAQHSDQRVMKIGGDDDFGTLFVLSFYAQNVFQNIKPHYIPQASWPEGGLDWIICETEPVPGSKQLADRWHNSYELAELFPAASPSGFDWFLYRHKTAVEEAASHDQEHE
ncbi:MAG TPA: glycosyltransferase family 39 protein [Chthoniobacterales bacterium]|jgi:hypothetical protein